MAPQKYLYHYTCLHHLPAIFSTGYLKTTESNISPIRMNAGPDVVWLTTRDYPGSGTCHGLDNGAPDTSIFYKRRVRFTVALEVDEIAQWVPWAKDHGIESDWLNILCSAGGSRSWFITEKPILQDRWIEVRDLSTDEILYGRQFSA